MIASDEFATGVAALWRDQPTLPRPSFRMRERHSTKPTSPTAANPSPRTANNTNTTEITVASFQNSIASFSTGRRSPLERSLRSIAEVAELLAVLLWDERQPRENARYRKNRDRTTKPKRSHVAQHERAPLLSMPTAIALEMPVIRPSINEVPLSFLRFLATSGRQTRTPSAPQRLRSASPITS
jgi:hypothetical protein